ncbi:MAG: DNA translocase FtsK [Parachlamydiaceae bacterium]|nr:DNA translocase FtsK [Parachlamydiaceae bacterium]
MAKKQIKKLPKSKVKLSLPKRDTSEIRGFLLLISSVLLFLSLISYAFDSSPTNMLGLLGQSLGWFFHSLFGLGSYLICGYAVWRAWHLIFRRAIENSASKALWFTIFTASFCVLISLVEDVLPAVGTFLQSAVYPSLWEQKKHFHLGGAFFYYFYHDQPTFNLYRIFSSVGVGIIFSSTLILSLLHLFNASASELIVKLWTKLTALQGEKDLSFLLASSPSEQPPAAAPVVEKGSFLRYVKLRIPGSNQTPNQNATTSTSLQHELLAIQPETNLKSRPSLSNKQDDKSFAELPAPQKLEKKKLPTPVESPLALELKKANDTSKASTPPSPPQSKEKRREEAITAQQIENGDYTDFQLPAPTLLTSPKKIDQSSLKKDLRRQAEVLEETLSSFGIEAKVGQINCGPTINSFEVHPAIGVKVQKIKALENDIALNMEAKSIRIIAPIPGKAAVGIEVPNPQPQEVSFREMLQAYQQGGRKFHIPVLLGKAVNGDYVMNDLTKMPHCIIAGATGSGKSVCINTIVMSILLNSKPDEVKMIMIDPKKVELTPYTRLPHMLAPVITEPAGACAALHWLVKEMEKRYETLKQTGTRNIETFNTRKIDKELEASLNREIPAKYHYIVCIVDELADLMMVSSSDIETPIARIAQMARAVGIHLILATQRPSREVITGLIKANFPTRIAFKVASRINSQIILDETGAESLLGNGDMLFLPPGSSHLIRAQGAFIRDEDINSIVSYLCSQATPKYEIASFDTLSRAEFESNEGSSGTSSTSSAGDSLYDQALDIVQSTGNASTTFLQRKLKVGYARAASLIDELEANGIVGQADGSRARKLIKYKNDEGED